MYTQPGAIGLHRQRAARPLWTLSAVWPQEVTKAVRKGGERRGEAVQSGMAYKSERRNKRRVADEEEAEEEEV